jgi:hypothetical protein
VADGKIREPDVETKRLQAEVAELRKRDQEREQRQQQTQRQQQFTEMVERDVSKFDAIRQDPKLVSRWPHAAKVPAHLLKQAARDLILEAHRTRARVTLDDIAAQLDHHAKELYGDVAASGPAVNGSALGKGPPKAPAQPETLTNAQAAGGAGTRRAKTQEELDEEFDRLAQQLWQE